MFHADANAERRSKSVDTPVSNLEGQADFFQRASAHDVAPLWVVLADLVTSAPRPTAAAHRWRYSEIRPFLLEAAELVTAEEAERRVLVLENPAQRGQSRISESMYAGLQILKPGETAPAHRHVSTALRFIVEGSDAYTAVDGERTMMRPGDFVTTPSWVWHDHGSFGSEPMIWLDGLDLHVVNLLQASFREEHELTRHPLTRPDDSSMIEFGYAMAPANRTIADARSPVLNYPYSRTKELLKHLASYETPDQWQGHIIKYLNPLTGDWAIPTMATNMRLLPEGFSTKPYRSTDATIFVVVEGSGVSRIGDTEFDWAEHDVFIAPSWSLQEHRASRESVLFSYSDRAVQEKLHLWREARLET